MLMYVFHPQYLWNQILFMKITISRNQYSNYLISCSCFFLSAVVHVAISFARVCTFLALASYVLWEFSILDASFISSKIVWVAWFMLKPLNLMHVFLSNSVGTSWLKPDNGATASFQFLHVSRKCHIPVTFSIFWMKTVIWIKINE